MTVRNKTNDSSALLRTHLEFRPQHIEPYKTYFVTQARLERTHSKEKRPQQSRYQHSSVQSGSQSLAVANSRSLSRLLSRQESHIEERIVLECGFCVFILVFNLGTGTTGSRPRSLFSSRYLSGGSSRVRSASSPVKVKFDSLVLYSSVSFSKSSYVPVWKRGRQPFILRFQNSSRPEIAGSSHPEPHLSLI